MIKLTATILAVVTFLLTAVITAAALFFPVIFLAGPHSDLLPAFGQTLTLLLAWLTIVLFPLFLSVKSYRWYVKRHF